MINSDNMDAHFFFVYFYSPLTIFPQRHTPSHHRVGHTPHTQSLSLYVHQSEGTLTCAKCVALTPHMPHTQAPCLHRLSVALSHSTLPFEAIMERCENRKREFQKREKKPRRPLLSRVEIKEPNSHHQRQEKRGEREREVCVCVCVRVRVHVSDCCLRVYYSRQGQS